MSNIISHKLRLFEQNSKHYVEVITCKFHCDVDRSWLEVRKHNYDAIALDKKEIEEINEIEHNLLITLLMEYL
jgi:vancomycin permeability regulator SanA